jgi:hypothetical protein
LADKRIAVTCKFWRENVWRYIRSLDKESFRLLGTYLAKEDIGVLYDEVQTTQAERTRFVEDLLINLHKKSLLQRVMIQYSPDIHREKQSWLRIVQKVVYVFKSVTHLELEAFDEFGKDLLHILLRATPSLTTLIIRRATILDSTYVPGTLFKPTLTDLILDQSFKAKFYSSVTKEHSLVNEHYMGAMPRLQRLELIDLNEEDYSGLQILTNLTRLSLKDNTLLTQDSALRLSTLTNLKVLDLSGTTVSTIALSFPKGTSIIQTSVILDICEQESFSTVDCVDSPHEDDDYEQDAFTLDF